MSWLDYPYSIERIISVLERMVEEKRTHEGWTDDISDAAEMMAQLFDFFEMKQSEKRKRELVETVAGAIKYARSAK